ncbi:MAG: zinc ribbon domain-containing protein, partial [Thermaerobacter sp.]|nr:zinc ribbon domain-containing protein [Thermaerobacter sp.]
PDNRRSQAEFVCQRCGHTDNADHNAAVVIAKRGIKKLLSGDPLTTSHKTTRIFRKRGPERSAVTPGEVAQDVGGRGFSRSGQRTRKFWERIQKPPGLGLVEARRREKFIKYRSTATSGASRRSVCTRSVGRTRTRPGAMTSLALPCRWRGAPDRTQCDPLRRRRRGCYSRVASVTSALRLPPYGESCPRHGPDLGDHDGLARDVPSEKPW